MLRRRFLELLAVLPLAALFGLQTHEEDEYDLQGCTVECANGVWTCYGPDGTTWISHDVGETWWQYDKTIYVSPLGNDTCDGLTPETAKHTIAAAMQMIGNRDSIFFCPDGYIE